MSESEVSQLPSEPPPTISVIIPAYNAAEYIGEAIGSVLDQTYTSYQLIVINDGSPDSDGLERELGRFQGIQYITQENRGAAAARNAGLRCAEGEFVAFLDADDRWLSNFLESQLELLISTNADVVFADARLFGPSPLAGRTFMSGLPPKGDVTAESLLAEEVAVLTSTVVARKKSILEVGLFDETMRRGHDFLLWLRLAKNGARFAYQRTVLAEHRILESGLSGNTISQLERTLAVLDSIKRREKLTAGEEVAFRLTLQRTLGELAVASGKEKLLRRDFAGALQSFVDARRFRQTWKLALLCFGMQVAPEAVWRMYHRRNSGA
jgi:glycosyltransferase involved in cell wall biosynthesis